MTYENKRAYVIGLLIGCPYFKDSCRQQDIRNAFKKDPNTVIDLLTEELVDSILQEHIRCSESKLCLKIL